MLNAMELALIKKLGGGNGGGGGGSGADLLNANGIIKQEVLPVGYPYAESGYILPPSTFEVLADEPMILVPQIGELIEGKTYSITLNGVAYECVAKPFAFEGMGGSVIGNLALLGIGEDSGETFIVAQLNASTAAQIGGEGLAMFMDGSTSVTVSIEGEIVTKMDDMFLPSNDFVLGLTGVFDAETGKVVLTGLDNPAEAVIEALEKKKNVKAVLAYEKDGITIKRIMPVQEYSSGEIHFSCLIANGKDISVCTVIFGLTTMEIEEVTLATI